MSYFTNKLTFLIEICEDWKQVRTCRFLFWLSSSSNFYFNKNIHLSPYSFKYGQRILKNQYILISRFQILFEINMKYFFQFHLKQNTFWHFIVCNWSISSVWQKLPKVIKSRTKQIVDICSYKYNIKYNSMNRLSLVYFKVQSLW